jgi:integrase
MSIKKRDENGQTVYDVFVKVRDKSGRQKARRKLGLKSEREALRFEFDLKTELESHRSKILWSTWVQQCLEQCRLEYKYSTWLNYKTILDKWVNPRWSSRFIDEITTSDVHDLIFNIVDGVSYWHRRNILKLVRRIFMMAVEDGVLAKNPTLKIKVKVPQAVQKVLNPNEIEILLKEAKAINHPYSDIWTFALLTGMRSGEMYALKWSDIDLVSNFIHVTKAWTSKDGFGITKSAKNHVVPISSECRIFLAQLKLKRGNEEFILPHLESWNRGNQAQELRTFCVGIGITSVKFHDLRATFITQLLKQGVSLARVMAIVGHTELKTTQGYLRLCGHDLAGATESLGIKLPEEPTLAKVVAINSRLKS